MKIIFAAFLATWITIASTFVFAQSNISGKVLDANGKPADAATIMLVNATDSAVIKTALADADGKYQFSSLKKGFYKIWVTMMGFKNYKSSVVNLDQDDIIVPDITLKQTGQMLKDVAITARKAVIEQKIDRTVVNVDVMIGSAGTTAMDVLEKSPGVQVDQNGNISLKGKSGVTVFIDDKPTYLSGADLENYLRSISSSSLSQIEIMTNPPAKYDAAGSAGIINIKTKRTNIKGFNGGLNLSINQGKLTRSSDSFNFNYRNNKVSFFGNFNYNLNNSFSDLYLNRTYKNADDSPKSYFEQNSYFKRHGNSFTLKTGADYYQSDKTTWGIILTGMARTSVQVKNNTSNLLNPFRQLDSIIVADNNEAVHYKNGGVNLNYRKKFSKAGHELSANADYITYQNHTTQFYKNYSFFASGEPKSQDDLSGWLPTRINIYSVKTDYEAPLVKSWKLAAGLKSSYTQTDNTADYQYTIHNITLPDYDKSNHFIYKENINAGYINVSKEGKKLSVQAGLRIENTVSNGHQLGNVLKPDSAFNKRYISFFPTLYFNYKLDTMANNQVGINYGRRIERPYYQDLNPFLSPLDKFTYYSGNPFLKPAFIQSFELSYIYKSKITTTFTYSKTRDDVNETIEIKDGIYYSKPGNIGSKVIKSLSVNAELDPFKWLNSQIYTEVANIASKSDFYTGTLNTSGTYWYIGNNSRFALGKGWDAEISGNYRTKLYDAQFILGHIWQANTAVQKKLSASTTLKLSVNDIFYTKVNTGVITNLAQTDASWINKSDTRYAILSLSYRFGKALANQPKHNTSSAESEQNRVKN